MISAAKVRRISDMAMLFVRIMYLILEKNWEKGTFKCCSMYFILEKN